MPYCPKCGVEVDDIITECPLCKFPIPNVGREEIKESLQAKYPVANNIYLEHKQKIKSQIFFVIIVILISALVVLSVVEFVYPVKGTITSYLFIVLLSLFIYSFLVFGFLNRGLTILGMTLTTMVITFFLSKINDGNWFKTYALPLIIVVYINVVAFDYIYRHSKKKNRFGYLPAFSLLICSSLCLGIESIISLNIYGVIHLTWSLIVSVTCILVAYLLHIIINNLSDMSIERIKRKFHL